VYYIVTTNNSRLEVVLLVQVQLDPSLSFPLPSPMSGNFGNGADTEERASLLSVKSIKPSPDTMSSAFGLPEFRLSG